MDPVIRDRLGRRRLTLSLLSIDLPCRRFTAALTILFALALATQATAAPPDVIITADNAYRFYVGDPVNNSVAPAGPSVENTSAMQIFSCSNGPEAYSNVAVGPGDYFYIVAYSDNADRQGVIAEIRGALKTFRTGDPGWAVCATGIDFDLPGDDPTPEAVTALISLCDGGFTPSGGWATETTGASTGRLEIGEKNDDSTPILDCPGTDPPSDNNIYQQACAIGANGINPLARWMWYNRDPANVANGFCDDLDYSHELLIFRYSVPTPFFFVPALDSLGISTLILCLLMGGGWMLWRYQASKVA